MNERDKLINKLIEEKGGTRAQYLDLLNSIAYHESAGTFDPTLHQYGGGPGRGKYQFEVGKNRGAITAARRLKRYYKDNNINTPNWLNKVTKDNSLDVTELTSEQQDLLFLGNMRMHPKADLANIINGKESIPEFWANYHWAGNKSDRPERLESFNSSYENYKNTNPEEIIASIEQNEAEEINYREPLPTMVQESTRVRQPMNMNSLLSYIKQNQPQQQPQQQTQPQQFYDKELNHYNGGGTHQQNPLGGIPQGNKSVEANETSFKLPQGKFIFSDRISTNGQMQPKLDGSKQQVSNSYNNQFADGGYLIPKRRNGVRQNPDGTVSTHRMAYGSTDNGYVAHPTLFQNPDGTWVEGDFQEAKRRGEVYNFKTEDEARNFAGGNWKKMYNTRNNPIDERYNSQVQIDNTHVRKFAYGGPLNNTIDPPTKVESKPKRDLSRLDKLFFDFSEDKENRPKFQNPLDIIEGNDIRKYGKIDDRFSEIHRESGRSCLAGSLNCSQEFISKNSGLPGLRTIISNSNTDPSKYKIKSRDIAHIGDYIPNQSVDAWEIHDYLVNEGLGTSLFQKDENTKYSKDSYLPEGFDYKDIPLGAVIGQGNSAGVYTNPSDGERSRHALIVVGFDNKDGMPMVYDYGKLTRLDRLNALRNKKHKINRITVPNEYKGMTGARIRADIEAEKKRLGLLEMKPISYGSDERHIQAIEKGVNEVAQKIAYSYQLPKSTITGLSKILPGLSNQETKINNNEGISGSIFADNAFGNSMGKEILKDVGDAATWVSNLFKDEGEYKQDYQLEIEAYKKYPNDEKKFKDHFNKLKKDRGKIKERLDFKENNNPSVGPFAIKDLTDYSQNELGITKGDMYGISKSNSEELENGAKAALSFLAENYNKLQEKYPDLTEQQLIDLTIVSYNNKGKTEDPEFIKYYIKGNKLKDNYLEKVKSYKPNKKKKK